MDYAVISTGGKQYKVNSGSILEVESLRKAEGDAVAFDQVLLVVNGDTVSLGKPTVAGAVVTGKVLGAIKGDKIRVSKFRAKSRHRRVMGHRQSLTRVQIESIDMSSKPAKTEKSEVTEEKPARKTAPRKK